MEANDSLDVPLANQIREGLSTRIIWIRVEEMGKQQAGEDPSQDSALGNGGEP